LRSPLRRRGLLHAFQKKSKKGTATPKAEIDLIEKRLKDLIKEKEGRQWQNRRRPRTRRETCRRSSYKIVQRRATVDEDGHYAFAVALWANAIERASAAHSPTE
jgi:dsRNA-specific ribonuclease